jgi:hypothetical protein
MSQVSVAGADIHHSRRRQVPVGVVPCVLGGAHDELLTAGLLEHAPAGRAQ